MHRLYLRMKHGTVSLYELQAHTADEWHDHGEFFQVSLPLIGQPHMQFLGESRALLPQTRAVIAPGQEHRNEAREQATRLLLISLDRTYLQKVYGDVTGRPAHAIEFSPWGEGSSEGLRRTAEAALKQTLLAPLDWMDEEQFEWDLAHRLLSLQIGSHTASWRPESTAAHHPALQRALDLLHDEAAEDLALDRLVAVSGVSRSHLLRLFQDTLGTTPTRYLTDIRLQRAEGLLTRTQEDVTAVAFAAGFGSLSSFERAFKRKHGMTASQYRLMKKE